MSFQLFLFRIIYFSRLLLPHPNFFETWCYHQIQNERIFFMKFLFTFFSVHNNEFEICKLLHSTFTYILLSVSNFFLELKSISGVWFYKVWPHYFSDIFWCIIERSWSGFSISGNITEILTKDSKEICKRIRHVEFISPAPTHENANK